MTKKILIAGNYGFYNTGDEAILSVMVSHLRRLTPDLEICIVSGDAGQTQSSFHVTAVSWQDIPAVIAQVEESDLILLGGGGIFNDYWGVQPETILTRAHAGIAFYSEFAVLARLLDKPLAIFAVGVGPLTTAAGREWTRLAFNLAQQATVRDAGSKRLLQRLGCETGRITLTADPAFCLERDEQGAQALISESIPHNNLPMVAACLRNWDVNCDQETWQRQVAQGLDSLCETHPSNFLFLPFHNLPAYPLTDDPGAAEAVAALMHHKENVVILRGKPAPEIVAGVISRSELVIGMRLHAVILGANAGVPVVALSYDPKVKQMMARLGLPEYSLNLTRVSAEELSGAAEKALVDGERIRALLHRKSRTLKRLAEKNFMLVDELLGEKRREAGKTGPEIAAIKWLALKQSRLLFEKETTAVNLARALSEKERQAATLQAELDAKEESIQRLAETARAQKERLIVERARVTSLEMAGLEKDHVIHAQKKLVDEKERTIQEHINHLDAISRSRGWKLLQFLWNVRLKLIPRGSRREGILKSIRRGSRRMFPAKKIQPPRLFRDGYIEQDNSTVTLYSDNANIFPGYTPRSRLSAGGQDDLKVSLIVTVKNEKHNIETWLEEVRSQTRLPDEIVIVDGGSTDGSFELLKARAQDIPFTVQVIRKEGANRSEARNIAIRQARHPLIAVTDFGCHIPPEWLERLIRPFSIDTDTRVSAGFYCVAAGRGNPKNRERLWANLEHVHPQSFLPSSRSVAFTREAVEAVGGHPEWLATTGDDTYLDLELKRLGGKWAFVPEAVVEWQAPDSCAAFLRKNYQWASGDGESGVHARYYWRYAVRLAGWMAVSLAAIGAVILFCLLPVRPVWLWSALIGAVYLAGLWLTAKQAGLGLPLLFQKMAGEGVQVLGFIRGVRRRKEVAQRRYALLKGVMIILAGVPMEDTGGGSRGAQIADELLRQGYLVVYINKFPRDESRDLGIKYVHPNLHVFSLSEFDLDRFFSQYQDMPPGKRLGAIVEFPLAEFLPLIEKIKSHGGRILYDLIDDWQTPLGGSWYSAEEEAAIVSASDVLAATVTSLQDHLQRLSRRPVALVPNAVNMHLFDPAARYRRPADLPESRRIILYIGALWGNWFDWDLLGQVVQNYRHDVVCVIGDYRGQCQNPPPNLKFLGLKPQRELPAYLAFSRVAIIPWKRSPISRATSPLKLYEYLAMRCPVVAPDWLPLAGIPGVWWARNQREFVELVGKADRTKLNEAEIREFIAKNDWQTRVRQMLALLGF